MLLNLLAAEGETKNNWIMWVIIGVVLVLMIVLTIVPQKKRQKEQQKMMSSLAVGTKLMTVGGIVGRITQVNSDNTLIINVGTENNPTLIVIDKKAVGYVLENVNAPVSPAIAEEPAVKDEESPAVEEKADEQPVVAEEGEVVESEESKDSDDTAVQELDDPFGKSRKKK